jgi:hypothetical protein
MNIISINETEDYLENFSVSLTGARAGDTLVGTSNVSRGAVIKIHYEDVLPNCETVNPLRAHKNIFSQALEKMKVFQPFMNMKKEEIDQWFQKNSNPRKAFLGEDGDKIRIELIQPGESNFAKLLSKEDLEKLLSGESFTLKEIEEMFPRKPGSKARHPTLMFIKHWWKVLIDYKMCDTYDGLCINLSTGKIVNGFKGEKKKKVITIEDVKVSENGDLGFISGFIPEIVDKKYVQKVIQELLGENTGENIGENIEEIYEEIIKNFKNYSPASYKSLLQKLIRFRSKQVQLLNGKLVKTELVLLTVLAELMLHPGAFVPDIQRFVSGIESMTKRLAVTIFEDSCFERKEDSVMLLGAALLCQRYKKFKPNKFLIKKWFTIALKALKSEKVYHWKIDKKYAEYILDFENSSFQNASALLDEVRSFGSDLNMVSYLASQKYKLSPPQNIKTPQAEVVPIWHGTDQHWAPDIVYYFDENIPKFDGSFGNFYWSIFKNVTGQNPRRQYTSDFENFEKREFVKELRKAQLRFLDSKQEVVQNREVLNKKYGMNETLHDGFLAGLVGVIEIRNFLVTLRYDDIYNLAVAKRPTRDVKDSYISPQDYERVIEEAKQKLKNGIKVRKSQLPCKNFEGISVILKDEEYFIKQKNILTPWEEFRKIRVIVPFHSKLNNFWDALKYKGEGLVEGAWDDLKKLLKETNINVLKRVLMYIASYDTEIELNHLNIKGDALHLAVNDKDIKAFQFMLKISSLFPGALSSKQYTSITFKVHTPLLLWRVKKRIANFIQREENEEVEGWKKYDKSGIKDFLNRKPWEHQKDSLEEMKENFRQSSLGHFIWLKVGLGKTLIVLNFIVYLFKSNKLPPYIIYSLPSSAIQSVINEIKAFGLKINLHIPLKNIKGRKIPDGAKVKQNADFEPFVVSIIEHDHLRLCKDELIEIAAKSVVIMDEVHKTLNDTKRTSIAVEICYLSYQFIAMTGTPVIDNKIYKLVAWLKQIVPFAIDEKNFWVAVNSMVSRKINTGVLVERHDILALFSPEEEKTYQKLVGPSIGGFNKNVRHEDIQEAIEICYKTATREIVEKVKSLLGEKKGVMVVAKNRDHQLELEKRIRKFEQKVYLIEKGGSIFLTDESVESGEEDYRVVITTIRQSEGYTLTRLNSFVSSIYFSNNAVREQLEGRINRIGQREKQVDYFYVHCGILTYIHRKYKDVKSLAMTLESLMEEIRQ